MARGASDDPVLPNGRDAEQCRPDEPAATVDKLLNAAKLVYIYAFRMSTALG